MTLGIIAGLIAIIIFCRYCLYTAVNQLSDEQKLLYYGFLTKLRILNLLTWVCAILGFLFVPSYASIVVIFYLIISIGELIFISLHIKKLNFPSEFLKDYIVFNVAIFVSLIVLIVEIFMFELNNFISSINNTTSQPVQMGIQSNQTPPNVTPANACEQVTLAFSRDNFHAPSEYQSLDWLKKNLGAPNTSIDNTSNTTTYKWLCPSSDSELSISVKAGPKGNSTSYTGQYCNSGKCYPFWFGNSSY